MYVCMHICTYLRIDGHGVVYDWEPPAAAINFGEHLANPKCNQRQPRARGERLPCAAAPRPCHL